MRFIDKIHERLKTISGYPLGVVPTHAKIAGTAFFPGGDGLWKEDKQDIDIPVRGIMIIGHNFDNVMGYKKSLVAGTEPLNTGTWRHLIEFIHLTEIKLSECFFTNVYIGLIDADSNVGVFPGAKCKAFSEKCLHFLDYQIEVQRPKLILTLGAHVPSLLAKLSPSLSNWEGISQFKILDTHSTPVMCNAFFCGGKISANVVALTHPSFRRTNVKHRRYKNLAGNEAELAMILDGCRNFSPV